MLGGWFNTLLVVAAAQSASDPAQPFGKWVVKYGATYCEARSQFTDQETEYSFLIRMAPTQALQLVIDAPQFKGQRSSTARGDGAVQIGFKPKEKAAFYGYTQDGRRRTTFELADQDQLTDIMPSETVSLEGDGSRRRLQLTAMPAVMQALADCERDLLKTWGADPALRRKVATPPKNKSFGPAAWFGANAYPADALASSAQGVSLVSLSVDESGKVTACRILKSSGNASLDRAACAPMLGHSSVFHPALDGSGNPVPAQVMLPVAWTAPVGTDKALADAPFGIVITSR